MIRTHNKLVNINYNIKTIMFLLLSLVVYSGYIFDSFFGLSTTNDYLFFCLLDFLYSFLTLQKLSLNNISTRSNSKYEHVPIIFLWRHAYYSFSPPAHVQKAVVRSAPWLPTWGFLLHCCLVLKFQNDETWRLHRFTSI